MFTTRSTVGVLTVVLASFGAACADRAPAGEAPLREVAAPAAAPSAEPNLSAHGERAYLSWIERIADGTHEVRFAVWEGGSWSAARTIARGESFFVNWADFPSVVGLPDGRLAAHWLVRSGPATYAYDVHVAQSADGGESWHAPVVPHRDGTQTEHGFVSLFPWQDGSLAAIWLDGRNFAAADGQAHHGGADMTLRHTTLGPAGELGVETVLDERVCDCCQTSVALTARGPIAVYRDRSVDEVRDISAVRYLDGRWTSPQPVHEDGWQIPGCPVNGPVVAAEGERVAVAWFTAAQETPRVRLAFSADAGASFAPPLQVDDGDPIGRVDVVLLPGGDALVAWLERGGDDAEIRMRRVAPDGTRGAARVVSASSAARASGFPRIARVGDDILFAWTQTGDQPHIRTAVARAP